MLPNCLYIKTSLRQTTSEVVLLKDGFYSHNHIVGAQ